ncbi:MAG: opuBC [Bacilli bacterium]|nr:opuBC [Bacilli bacterium]
MKKITRITALSFIILLSLVVSACSQATTDTIKIGTQTFTEAKTLAEMYKALIEDRTKIKVEIVPDLAASTVVLKAIKSNEIQMGTLYSGEIFNKHFPVKATKERHEVLKQAQEGFNKYFDLKWFDSYGFENTYALTVTKDVANQYKLNTVSDLKSHAKDMNLGVDTTWLERGSDGYKAFTQFYGFSFKKTFPMEISLVHKAAADKKVDVVVAYTTDAGIKQYDLKTLKDDKQFFPPYDASPVVRNDTLKQHPELNDMIALLVGKIDTNTMSELNYEVEVHTRSPKDVAYEFLKKINLLDVNVIPPSSDLNFLQYVQENAGHLLYLTWEHIVMVFCGLGLALIVGIPFGVLSARSKKFAAIILPLANFVQVIPSLALLALLMIVLGLGFKTIVVGLFLYSLLPIIRNTYVGLNQVDPGISEAGKGVGMSPMQLLLQVQLPLSLPFLMAGLRIAAVIAVGVATLAPIIGGEGLGREIYSGLNLHNNIKIYAGAIPACLLAILADIFLGMLQNKLKIRSQ